MALPRTITDDTPLFDLCPEPPHAGKVIAAYLEEHNISLREFGHRARVSYKSVWNIIHAREALTLKMAYRLADAMGCRPELLLHYQIKFDEWRAMIKRHRPNNIKSRMRAQPTKP